VQLPTEPVQNVSGTDHYLVPQSVGVRAVAYIIDSLIFALIVLVILYAVGAADALLDSTALSWPQLAVIGGQCGYFFIFEALFGRTPGKMILQLRVVRTDGRRVGVGGAFIRNLIRPLDLFFFGLIGAASILAGFKRQRIGDRLGHTQVVRELPLALVPPPYVPADKSSRRCPRCGALAEGDQSTCAVCGLDLDSAPPWPFGGIVRPPGAPGRRPRPTSGGTDAAPAADRPKRPAAPSGARPGTATGRRPAASRPRPAAHAERPSRAASERPDRPPPYESLRSPHAIDLYADDDDERLYAAREILMEGDKDEARELAKVVRDWELDDRQFVVDVARTLDGWRPIMVLEALRSDSDEDLADGARHALATVKERTRREEEEQRAWEAARAVHDEDDEDDDARDEGLDEGPDEARDGDLDEESPAPAPHGDGDARPEPMVEVEPETGPDEDEESETESGLGELAEAETGPDELEEAETDLSEGVGLDEMPDDRVEPDLDEVPEEPEQTEAREKPDEDESVSLVDAPDETGGADQPGAGSWETDVEDWTPEEEDWDPDLEDWDPEDDDPEGEDPDPDPEVPPEEDPRSR
jgi:uncharacterized RDD family membrane protein YckC